MSNLQELKQKYKELGEEIERLEKKKRWRAKPGETYYFIGSYLLDVWCCNSDGSKNDTLCYELGNYFKTKEEAQEVADKIKTYIELKQLAEELNGDEEIDWKDKNQNKYYIFYSYTHDRLLQDNWKTIQYQGTIYCLDKNFKEKAIEKIGEERLKKLFI